MDTESQHRVVLTTFSNEEEMSTCIAAILEKRLAACIQQIKGNSSYRWEGKVQTEEEYILLIKTTASREDELRAFIESIHSYDVPEIISLPIVAGSEPYLRWLDEETS